MVKPFKCLILSVYYVSVQIQYSNYRFYRKPCGNCCLILESKTICFFLFLISCDNPFLGKPRPVSANINLFRSGCNQSLAFTSGFYPFRALLKLQPAAKCVHLSPE